MSDARAVIDAHVDAFNNRTPEKEPWAAEAELVSPGGVFTGRTVSFRWSATYRADGSELLSEHLYFDQLDFLGQLGVLPV